MGRGADNTPAAARLRQQWNEKVAYVCARQALQEYGLGDAELTPVRFGTNAVYRVGARRAPLILRISSPEKTRAEVDREILLTTWLAEQGLPVSVAVADSKGIGVYNASLWRYVLHDTGEHVNALHFGQLVRSFHEISEDCPVQLPDLDIAWKIQQKLQRLQSTSLAEKDKTVLQEHGQRLLKQLEDQNSSLLGYGVIHTDLHAGNVIAAKTPVLIDFEGARNGMREWDLVSMASEQFEANAGDYQQFAEGYGYDVRSSPLWPTLSQLRLLSATLWLTTLPNSEKTRKELSNRMRYWHNDKEAPLWRAL